MSIIKLKKGLDIKLNGEAQEKVTELGFAQFYAVKPADFKNVIPKIVAKAQDKVKVGSILFQDKYNSQIVFTSPVSGTLTEIKRGERRKILEFIIKPDQNFEYVQFKSGSVNDFSKDEIIQQILNSGLWTKIIKRPFGTIAKPNQTPDAIHISTFDSAPLAPNYNFTLKDNIDEFQNGVDFLSKISDGKVHVNIDNTITNNIFANVSNATVNKFEGKHPAGNVGVQIHHTTPIVSKDDLVWTINPQDVVFIGRLFKNGTLDFTKTVAVTGHEVNNPQYVKIIAGAKVSCILKDNLKSDNIRIISGNVLTGKTIDLDGFIGINENHITVITEGNYYEMFGWAKPGFNKFSVSRAFFGWLNSNKKWELDTNTHGGVRSFVLTGQIDKVFPMDIMPIQLLKACATDDIDLMEKLGIYEVLEEDFALCEVISETKMDFQDIIEKAIALMIAETE
ncbi:MAG: Na(+)-translocating NADH-quinone reductase subunit A [Bacteroidales bacterium]|nr:Na(+)-translocating NADH-quinone reductase subunit A [Bacteroidales bacterium]